jgi:hypothetical protein
MGLWLNSARGSKSPLVNPVNGFGAGDTAVGLINFPCAFDLNQFALERNRLSGQGETTNGERLECDGLKQDRDDWDDSVR